MHALIGENGGGKSTLMKIIGGIHRPDTGSIEVDGESVAFSNPQAAMAKGISLVHQELSLVPNLSIAQNVFSQREPTNWLGFVKWDELHKRTRELMERLGVDIDPATMVAELSVGIRQLVEIAKALSMDAKILVLDEPTSAVSEKEVETLYRIVDDLKAAGVSIIFISHKLPEVFRISDRISVLRDGRMIGTVKAEDTDTDEIIHMMVGRSIEEMYPPRASSVGETVLSVEGLSRGDELSDLSFELKKGEILGFAGLVGSGRTETARAIFGADPVDAGTITLHGRTVKFKSALDAINHGVCYLTEDRKDLGLFLTKNVRTNIVSSSLKKFASQLGLLQHSGIEDTAKYYVQHVKLRPADDKPLVMNLSGGNQQKALLAKWLCADPQVLIVDEPTRGVDVGAKTEIHSHLRQLANSGVGVIVISSELPEILGLCDRVAVFNEGRITAVLDGEGTTQEDVMKYATM